MKSEKSKLMAMMSYLQNFMSRIKYGIYIIVLFSICFGQRTIKPVIHGKHWIAITGKPLGATAGATIEINLGSVGLGIIYSFPKTRFFKL